jgi:Flp pilus assembly secretin CpaC
VTVVPPQEVVQQADRQWERLRDTLRDLYPDSDITLTPASGKLIVQGTVASDDEAIQILSLVRRMQLIPIVDRLVVKRSPR